MSMDSNPSPHDSYVDELSTMPEDDRADILCTYKIMNYPVEDEIR